MIGITNVLTLDKETKTINIEGFMDIDKNSEITFCMEDQGVFIYNGILNPERYTHYITRLENGQIKNELIYVMLEDRGLEQENLFMKCGKSYFETNPHPFVE